jgi:hypothetical protein
MSHVAPTQVTFPWKTALRTALQTFLAVAVILIAVAPLLQEFVNQFWPDSPAVAWIGTASVFVAALAGLIARIMAIPGVNAALTKIGFGAAPKL